jgi:putative redox protein
MDSTVRWKGQLAFEAEVDGHTVVVDALPSAGGQGLGPRPKALVLTALAGCTAIDVAGILEKMRQPLVSLAVKAAGETTVTHPKVFHDVLVTYEVTGDVDPEKLWRAVSLSKEKYCGVSAMLSPAVRIEHRVVLNGRTLAPPARDLPLAS